MNALESDRTLRVIGIDPALSKTGICVIEFDGERCRADTYLIATEPPSPKPGNAIVGRRARIKTISARASVIIPDKAELGLIEGPALDADFGNSWDRAQVWGSIIDVLIDRGIPVAEIPPATLKKWATKSGRADKRLVVEAMRSMWPGVACTTTEQRHHECEALAMATLCGQRLQWPVPVRAHQGSSLGVVKWPVRAPTS